MYNIIYKCREPEQGEPMKIEVLRVKCLQENAVLPKRGSEGAIGYDLSASYNCVIPSRGKGLVRIGLAIRLPSGVYARIAHRSGLALKKFINVGAGVVDSDYRGELGFVLYNHSKEDFKVNKGDTVAQLILERIKTPVVQKVQALDPTDRGARGFGSTGMQS